MSDIAIRCEGLSKQYRIGKRERYKALRDVLTDGLSAPFRALSSAFRNGHKSPISNLESNVTSDLRRPTSDLFWALDDVSFEISHGEVVGIIGRNGAGKSTLLKILSRITEPTRGFAEINGRVGSLLEVGTGFHPELTGRENIYLNGAILGMKRAEIERRFDEIVAFAETEKFLDTPVKYYSSGMQMRLAFAVAAHLQPEILLVDEVLAVGDAAFQKKCLGKMGDVAREGRTVLFVSHNMAAVRSLCSRALLLADGEISYSGLVDNCIDKYLLAVSDDMQAEIDTAELTRPPVVDGANLRITRLRLNTSNGRALLYTGQPMSLEIEFKSVDCLHDVVFGWSVHASDTARLFECITADSYEPIAELPPGRYVIRCTLPRNPLNPGWYTLHVGARCALKGLDYLPDVMTFRVEVAESLQSLWLELHSGYMHVPCTWVKPVPIESYGQSTNAITRTTQSQVSALVENLND